MGIMDLIYQAVAAAGDKFWRKYRKCTSL